MKTLFQISIVISSIYGVTTLIGIWDNTFNGQQLLYYTILSNLIISLYFLYHLIPKPINKKREFVEENLLGGFTLMISVTGLIYHFILVPQITEGNPYGADTLANFLVHTYTPFAVVIDWIFFEKIRSPQRLKPLYWLFIPLSYWILSIFYASFQIPFVSGSYYAYFFIDAIQLGWKRVLLNVLFLIPIFWGIGYILKFIKTFQLKHQNK